MEINKNQGETLFSMVVLFYNEEGNVVPVVTSLQEALDKAGLNYQLILVDNGSRDGTPQLIKNLVGHDQRLKMITVEKNMGYGFGATEGMKAAQGDWVGIMGGDGQVAPSDVVRLLEAARSGKYDLVKVRRATRQDWLIRCVISDVYIMIFSLIFHTPFYDVNATPSIFRRELLDKFRLVSRDWFLDAEIVLKADYLGLKIEEVPIIYWRRLKGRSNVTLYTTLEFIKNIIRFRLGKEMKKWKEQMKPRCPGDFPSRSGQQS